MCDVVKTKEILVLQRTGMQTQACGAGRGKAQARNTKGKADGQPASLAWWDTVGSAAGTGWDPPASRSLRSEPDKPKGPFAARKQLPQLIKHEKLQPDEHGGKKQPGRRELERIALVRRPRPSPRASPAGPRVVLHPAPGGRARC